MAVRKITLAFGLLSGSAQGAETVVYTYDAQGRMIDASFSGTGDNANLRVAYQFDLAGNRVRTNVTGSKNGGQQVVVMFLDGYVVMPTNP